MVAPKGHLFLYVADVIPICIVFSGKQYETPHCDVSIVGIIAVGIISFVETPYYDVSVYNWIFPFHNLIIRANHRIRV